jgi:hypothetical protein
MKSDLVWDAKNAVLNNSKSTLKVYQHEHKSLLQIQINIFQKHFLHPGYLGGPYYDLVQTVTRLKSY